MRLEQRTSLHAAPRVLERHEALLEPLAERARHRAQLTPARSLRSLCPVGLGVAAARRPRAPFEGAAPLPPPPRCATSAHVCRRRSARTWRARGGAHRGACACRSQSRCATSSCAVADAEKVGGPQRGHRREADGGARPPARERAGGVGAQHAQQLGPVLVAPRARRAATAHRGAPERSGTCSPAQPTQCNMAALVPAHSRSPPRTRPSSSGGRTAHCAVTHVSSAANDSRAVTRAGAASGAAGAAAPSRRSGAHTERTRGLRVARRAARAARAASPARSARRRTAAKPLPARAQREPRAAATLARGHADRQRSLSDALRRAAATAPDRRRACAPIHRPPPAAARASARRRQGSGPPGRVRRGRRPSHRWRDGAAMPARSPPARTACRSLAQLKPPQRRAGQRPPGRRSRRVRAWQPRRVGWMCTTTCSCSWRITRRQPALAVTSTPMRQNATLGGALGRPRMGRASCSASLRPCSGVGIPTAAGLTSYTFVYTFQSPEPVKPRTQPVAMATPLSESTANARQVRRSHPPPPAPSPSARAQHRGAPHSDAIAQVAVPSLVALHAVPLLVAALLVARAHVRRSSRGGGHLHSQSPVHPRGGAGVRG